LSGCKAANRKDHRALTDCHLAELLAQLSAVVEQTSPADVNANANNNGMKHRHFAGGALISPSVRLSVCLSHGLGSFHDRTEKGKGSTYSINKRRVPELIPVLGSQPAGDLSHKPGGWLPLLSARSSVTLTTLNGAATSFAAW